MVVITCLAFMAVAAFVAYWVGRGVKLNRGIKDRPEDFAVDLKTGEVIERGTPEWTRAERQGNLATVLTPENGAGEGVRFA